MYVCCLYYRKQPTFQTCSNANPSELITEMCLGLSDPGPAHTPQVHTVGPPVDHQALGPPPPPRDGGGGGGGGGEGVAGVVVAELPLSA